MVQRQNSRLTSALISADGACEITVLPRRNADSQCQLADNKDKALAKEGIV